MKRSRSQPSQSYYQKDYVPTTEGFDSQDTEKTNPRRNTMRFYDTTETDEAGRRKNTALSYDTAATGSDTLDTEDTGVGNNTSPYYDCTASCSETQETSKLERNSINDSSSDDDLGVETTMEWFANALWLACGSIMGIRA